MNALLKILAVVNTFREAFSTNYPSFNDEPKRTFRGEPLEDFVNSDDDELQGVDSEDSWTTCHYSRASSGYSRGSSSSCCGGSGDDEDDSYQERMVNDAVTCARLGRMMRIVDRANDIAARRR